MAMADGEEGRVESGRQERAAGLEAWKSPVRPHSSSRQTGWHMLSDGCVLSRCPRGLAMSNTNMNKSGSEQI